MRIRALWLCVMFGVTAGCGDCAEAPAGKEGQDTESGDVQFVDGEPLDSSDGSARDTVSAEDGASDVPVPVDGAVDGAIDGSTDDGGSDDSMDGTGGGADTDAMSGCSTNQQICGGSCVDPERDRDHCGGCGQSCTGREVCTSGDCVCPRYHTRCDGTCVATHVDPDNCGECGRACGSSEVCSGGTCVDSCLPGRMGCGRRCVDRSTDPDNCGSCGNICGSNEGCLDGSCEQAVSVGDAPAKCAGGGPQIDVRTKTGGDKRCVGNVAERVFRWAACSCEELIVSDLMSTDAYDSTLGRYRGGGLGGSVGTNARIEVNNDADVRGSVWASGQGRTKFDSKTEIHQQLQAAGTVEFADDSNVRGDGYVVGDVTADDVRFHQALNVRPGSSLDGQISYGSLNRSSQVSVGQACDQCAAADRIPVQEIVEERQGNANDNDRINLNADALTNLTDPTVLELPCGEYYLSEISANEKVTIRADGRTALYIDGDVQVGNNLTIKPSSSGELDVFVNGDVVLNSASTIGDPAYPASTRFYVGGEGGWQMRDSVRVGAYIYAVPGGLVADDDLTVYGGVYAQQVDAGNDIDIHYDRAILDAGRNCTPRDPDDDEPTGDAGMSDASGTDGGGTTRDAAGESDVDGGGNTEPTCRGPGEVCGGDEDCCAPLVCGEAGVCDAKKCRALYESCSSDSDCCSGTCSGAGSDQICTAS